MYPSDLLVAGQARTSYNGGGRGGRGGGGEVRSAIISGPSQIDLTPGTLVNLTNMMGAVQIQPTVLFSRHLLCPSCMYTFAQGSN